MKKLTILLGVLIVAIIALSGAFLITNADKPVTGRAVYQPQEVKIGYLPIASDLSFFVALDKGYFEEQGIIVKPIKFESSNQEIDALLSNNIDGTSIVGLEVLFSVEEKYPGEFKIFEMTAAEEDSTVHRIIVKRDSTIESISDLEGKTIGTNPGSQMKTFTELVLKNYVDLSKVNIVQIAPSLQVQALDSGQVDALFALEPIGTIAESKGISKDIAINPLYDELLKPFPTAASAFSVEFASKNPEIVERYLKAIEKAQDYIETDETEAKKSLSPYTTVDPAISSKVGIYHYWNRDEIDKEAVNKLIGIYVENGIISQPVSIDRVILS